MKFFIITITLFNQLLFIQLYGNNNESENISTISGKIADKQTGELLIGATIYLSELKTGTASGLDGTYILRNLPFGEYNLVCSYIGYESIDQKLIVNSGSQSIDFSLESKAKYLDKVQSIAKLDRHTEISARLSEKNALTVLNIMSAKAIEISPDLDVAGIIQRMSGVTIEKSSSGDAQYAIMRGMDKRYNYTLVNGVKIPSPNNKHRFVPLNMFPSELVDRVEVSKSLTADMEGDATGGAINIEMKDAPASRLIQANFSLGYNSFYLNNDFLGYDSKQITKQSPKEIHGKEYVATNDDFSKTWGTLSTSTAKPDMSMGFAIGDRIANNKIGLILAANYMNINKRFSSDFYGDSYSQQENTIIISNLRHRKYYENQQQLGIHLKSDYQINRNHKIAWYNALIKMDNIGIRDTERINFGLFYNPEGNNLDMSYQTRFRSNNQEIYVSNINTIHKLTEKIELDLSRVYSYANNREPEKSYFNLDRIIINGVDNIYPDADGSTREWAFNNDRDLGGYINLKYNTYMLYSNTTFKIGGLYRDKVRTNSQVAYTFQPNGSYTKGENFETLNDIDWNLTTPRGSVGALEYDANEIISAAYSLVHLDNENIDLSLGVRIENTNQGYFMYFPGPEHDSVGGQIYSDILPSFVFKYKINNENNLRASYFKSINRPGFFEIVPYLMIQEDYLEFGNIELERAKIDNVDIRWEFFPSTTEQLLVGLFYKNLKNPIELTYTTVNRRQFGYGPANLGDAQNIGIEVDVIKYLRNFGFKANYTYTYSAITTPKAYYGLDERESFTLMFRDQTRPLAAQSPHVANLSFLYKSTNKGFDFQFATAYTHDKIIIASRFYEADYWQDKTLQFDASFEKKLKYGFSLFGKFKNIFNSPVKVYTKATADVNKDLPGQDEYLDKTLISKNIYGRSFLLGVRFRNGN